jgi:hypothetical protein
VLNCQEVELLIMNIQRSLNVAKASLRNKKEASFFVGMAREGLTIINEFSNIPVEQRSVLTADIYWQIEELLKRIGK